MPPMVSLEFLPNFFLAKMMLPFYVVSFVAGLWISFVRLTIKSYRPRLSLLGAIALFILARVIPNFVAGFFGIWLSGFLYAFLLGMLLCYFFTGWRNDWQGFFIELQQFIN
jgi:hypothetical protein